MLRLRGNLCCAPKMPVLRGMSGTACAEARKNEEKEGTPEIHGRFMVELWDNCGISWEIIGL